MFDIKRFRHAKKMTQKQLAEILRREQSFISAMELGKSPVPRAVIDRLHDLYGDEIDKYRSNPPADIIVSDNISVKDLLVLIKKKDEQIDSLIEVLKGEIKTINNNIKKLQPQIALEGDSAVCVDVG